MKKFFNTAGPCFPDWHYMLPPEPRLPEARRLIDRGQYFVVHAPRQTGKTTTMLALARELTAEGEYAALYFSCERAEAAGDDDVRTQLDLLDAIREAMGFQSWPVELQPPDTWPEAAPGSRLSAGLSAWAQKCPRPLVLFFDEIDALRGTRHEPDQCAAAVARRLHRPAARLPAFGGAVRAAGCAGLQGGGRR